MTEEEMNRIADLVVEKMARRMLGAPAQPVQPMRHYAGPEPCLQDAQPKIPKSAWFDLPKSAKAAIASVTPDVVQRWG